MSTALVEYGIREERSDIRAHVSPGTQRVYVFKTADMVLLVDENEYRCVPAYQPGVEGPTAEGLLVPVDDVPDLRTLNWAGAPWADFIETDTTTQKGAMAVDIVKALMQMGRFPLWVDGHTPSTKMDIEGTDIIVCGQWRIQVKCDWSAGRKKDGGSGNLYIQLKERNPLGLH